MSEPPQEQFASDFAPDVQVQPKKKRHKKPRRDPRFHVILWNDDEHTYEYVIAMLQALFGYPPERGFLLAREVDQTGRAVIYTSSLAQAELKRDQILSYGPDPLLNESTGPLIATLEKDHD